MLIAKHYVCVKGDMYRPGSAIDQALTAEEEARLISKGAAYRRAQAPREIGDSEPPAVVTLPAAEEEPEAVPVPVAEAEPQAEEEPEAVPVPAAEEEPKAEEEPEAEAEGEPFTLEIDAAEAVAKPKNKRKKRNE